MKLRKNARDAIILMIFIILSIIAICFSFSYTKTWNSEKRKALELSVVVKEDPQVIQKAGDSKMSSDSSADNATITDKESQETQQKEVETSPAVIEQENIISIDQNVSEDVIPATYGKTYASISCHTSGLYADVVWGDDCDLMSKASTVCQYAESPQVGYQGCHLLLSHNYLEFNKLQYVTMGDIFSVKTSYGTFNYKVDRINTGKVTNDESNIQASDGAYLINLEDTEDRLYMYTCYPFNVQPTPTAYRYVVRASRI